MDSFHQSFAGFDDFLKNELLTNTESVKVNSEEPILSEAIFSRIESIPLIDKYDAYQILERKHLRTKGEKTWQ